MSSSIMLRPHRLGWIIAVGGLGACAPSVHLPPPQTGLPGHYEQPPPLAGATDQGIALEQWWHLFDDAQLTSLIEVARDRSSDARLAYFRIREARALYDQQIGSTLPTGDLSGFASIQDTRVLSSRDWTGQAGQIRSYTAAFSPGWEVDLFGRLSTTRAQGKLDYVAAAFDYRASLMTLAADVATGLFQARLLTVQLDDAGDTLRIARDLAGTARLGLARGLSAGADQARLDSDVATSRAELIRLDAALHTAKRALLILVGRSGDPTDSLAIAAILPPPPAVPPSTPGDLLIRRPDVLASQARLAAAARTVQISRLNLFPRFTIGAGGTVGRSDLSILGGAGTTSFLWSLAGNMVLPILDRPRLMAALRISEARGNQAIVTYEKTVQTAFREVEAGLISVTADHARLADLTAATQNAERAFAATRDGYRLGLTDLTTLLDSERSWRRARAAQTGAQAQALIDTVTTFRALGGGWSPSAPASLPGQTMLSLPDTGQDRP